MDRPPRTSSFQNRPGGPGRGPLPPFRGGRELRRGGPSDHRGPSGGPPVWRGHPGPGSFGQQRHSGPINGRGPMVFNQGPPPPPHRQGLPPPPPQAGALQHPGNLANGRRTGPPMIRPPVQRGLARGAGPQGRPFRQQHPSGGMHGQSFIRHGLPPITVPPPPPPPQAYSNQMLNNTLPAIAQPPNGFVPQQTSSSVQTVTATNNTNNNTPVWSKFETPAGLKYYYNSVTKESTYEKPAGFVSPQERSTSLDQETANPSQWKEYIDKATGKKYYFNGVTTTWEKPVTFAAAPALSSSTVTSVAEKAPAPSGDTTSDPPRKKLKTSTKPNIEFGSKDEAIAAFKGFLIAKDVSPTLKWSELSKMYSSDSRWIICEDALTTGERKQALAEYQTKRANELRLIERQEKVRSREAFMELLTDSLPKLKSFVAWNTSFKEIRDVLAKDDRFHAVADESTRESLFLDFCEEFRKREERRKRNLRREAQDNFIAFLSEKQESGSLSFASTWNSFVATLGEEEKNDSRFCVSTHMSESDREIYFADFVLELQAAEDDKRRRIRDARRRAEQAQRDAYGDFLCRLARDEGKLFPWSGWRELEGEITTDSSYGPLHEQNSDAPRQLFEEFVSDWNQRYRRDKELLGKLMRPTSQTEFVVDAETSYETFTKAILETAEHSADLLDRALIVINQTEPISSAVIYFKEMQSKSGTTRSVARRAGALRRGHYDSSEDEGEIVEDTKHEDEQKVKTAEDN